jgi:hypothetical protein
LTDVRICIPWGHDFEHAKSGLRDLQHKGEVLRKDVVKYKGYTFDIEPRFGSPNLVRLRNYLITDGGKTPLNYDWFFFVDSDIVWRIENLLKLLEHNTEVCCGPYIQRKGTAFECGLWKDKERPGPVLKRFQSNESGFKIVHFTGAGFLLINRHALEKLCYPYFRYVDFRDSDGGMEQMAEDWGFCVQCAEKGVRIWCDFDINISHKPRNPSPGDWLV